MGIAKLQVLVFQSDIPFASITGNQPERPPDLSECYEDRGVSAHSKKNATTYAFI
jgi:hypothetical protein